MPLKTTLLAVLLVSHALSAATIKGVVLTNEMGGPPIANVEVSAVDGANPVRSLSNGAFTLEFRDKQPGEQVQLIVQMPGMVVVNEFQLHVTLAKTNGPALTLLLCKSSEREEMARRFHRLPSVTMIEKSYQKRLDELHARNQATEAATEKLRAERDQARETARVASERLSQLTVTKSELAVSDAHRNAMFSIYESQRAQMFSRLGLTYRRSNWLDDALRAHMEALAIRRSLAKDDRDPQAQLDLAETLNYVGNVLSDLSRGTEALKAHEEALAIFRSLEKSDRNRFSYHPSLMTTLNHLGEVLRIANRPSEARKYFEEALLISRNLIPAGDLLDHERIRRIEEDLESYRKRVGISPASYLPDVAMTLRNAAILSRDQKRNDDARTALMQSLAIFEVLARSDPAQYEREVDATKKLLGDGSR
jgi:tetratricopeptide (TPR) repeat protein